MELYVLDALFRRVNVVDRFESLIWTERFSDAGDFELAVYSNRDKRNLFPVDTVCAVNNSYRMMVVKNVEDKEDDEGKQVLTISGPSYESVMKDRIAKEGLSAFTNLSKGTATMTIASPGVVTKTAHNLLTGDSVYFTTTGALPTNVVAGTVYYVIKIDANTFRLATSSDNAVANVAINTAGSQSGVHTLFWVSNGKWRLTGTPGNIARSVFQQICVTGTVAAGDIIQYLAMGPSGLFPADTIPEDSDVVTFDIDADTVFTVIQNLCQAFDLGFRILRAPEVAPYTTPQLYFDIYSGSDRTTLQTTLPPVIFAPELDNLSNTTELTTNADYKNIAYVFGENGVEIVYADGFDASTTGVQRKVLMVNANDIDLAPGAGLTAALQQRGRDELSKHKSSFSFDGQIPQFGSYKYMFDYNLGDLVEQRNSDAVTNNMRITEQIMVEDDQGERSYPTLSTELLITPGSWLAWDANSYWIGYDNVSKGTATITIASPGVVTNTGHGFVTGDVVSFKTTGALPTGLAVDTWYYVIFVNANTFRLASSLANAIAGTAINTTGSQSGVHTLYATNTVEWIDE